MSDGGTAITPTSQGSGEPQTAVTALFSEDMGTSVVYHGWDQKGKKRVLPTCPYSKVKQAESLGAAVIAAELDVKLDPQRFVEMPTVVEGASLSLGILPRGELGALPTGSYPREHPRYLNLGWKDVAKALGSPGAGEGDFVLIVRSSWACLGRIEASRIAEDELIFRPIAI